MANIKAWIYRVLINYCIYIYQQDGAPPHWHKEVRDYLYEPLPGRWVGRAEDTDNTFAPGHPVTRPDSVWFLLVWFRQGRCLRPTTSKDTTRIATAHQHHNRECHTRHAWEGLTGMGVSPGHLPRHTRVAHRMHLRSLWNCKHSSFNW